jgi:hypothetical protein
LGHIKICDGGSKKQQAIPGMRETVEKITCHNQQNSSIPPWHKPIYGDERNQKGEKKQTVKNHFSNGLKVGLQIPDVPFH